MGALRGAARHLTIVPVQWRAGDAELPPAATLPWFPFVGLAVGALAAGVLSMPIPALPRAALALLVWTAVTGGLHEDGLMDTADGAFAVAPLDKRLQILRDPHVGAHAVTALLLITLVRFAALTEVPPFAAPAAAVTGRWAMTLTLSFFRPARATGLGSTFSAGARPWWPTLVAAACLAGLYAGAGPRVIASSIIGVAAAMGSAYWLSRRFGGLSGDGHGAAGLIGETAVLVAFL
jgi:adenosylcobinamide-GDP ribazoletransferase